MNLLRTRKTVRLRLRSRYLLSRPDLDAYNVDRNRKKVIVALAADHGNLGDVAITYAQTAFLKATFPERAVIDFPAGETFSRQKTLKRICAPEDIITIAGGGNTGDMYDDIEYCRQFIIRQFPGNRIVSFPQTVDFSETSAGAGALAAAKKVYCGHGNLTLSAREEKSFDRYKRCFPGVKVVLAPDMVFYLDESLPRLERTGITICLRRDKEKNIDEKILDPLLDGLRLKYRVGFQDTHAGKVKMSVAERENALRKIWAVFKRSKLVITDRLHGMIFCAITGTPCLAFDNSNGKISGVYRAWLKGLAFICLAEANNPDAISAGIRELLDYKGTSSPQVNFRGYYNALFR